MEGFHWEFCEILANSCAAGKWLSKWLWIMLSQHMINTPVQARQAAIRIIRETNHRHPPAQQSSGY